MYWQGWIFMLSTHLNNEPLLQFRIFNFGIFTSLALAFLALEVKSFDSTTQLR